MKAKVKHALFPWQWDWKEENGESDCGIFYEKFPGHAYAIVHCPRYEKREQWEANASFIIRACSNHYELLGALKLAGSWISTAQTVINFDDNGILKKINLAIANTEKEENGMKTEYYVGLKQFNKTEVFRSAIEPTQESHGEFYNAIIGPFRTKAGAYFMANNAFTSYCQTVSNAEELAQIDKKK